MARCLGASSLCSALLCRVSVTLPLVDTASGGREDCRRGGGQKAHPGNLDGSLNCGGLPKGLIAAQALLLQVGPGLIEGVSRSYSDGTAAERKANWHCCTTSDR